MTSTNPRTFLSYNTADKESVDAIARRLAQEGLQPSLDKWNLLPDKPWQIDIEEALDSCTSCLVFIGPSGIGPWQHAEMQAAIDRRLKNKTFRVIPVLLPRANRGKRSLLPPFLSQVPWVEFRHTIEDKDVFRHLVNTIKGFEPSSIDQKFYIDACPYRGLQVFDVEHAPFFFGREALTQWLLNELRTAPNYGIENRFLAILGPSGSGKSSLARAGLVAAIKRDELEGSADWPCIVFKPGQNPLENLSVALMDLRGVVLSPSDILEIVRQLQDNKQTLHVLSRIAMRETPITARLVIMVDQFEEIFTLCKHEKLRSSFIDALMYAAFIPNGQTIVILTMRADFYGKCATYTDLSAGMSDHQILVGPMNENELRRAIEQPAHLMRHDFESGLIDDLVKDVSGQPGSLPLLQHALMELWENSHGRVLTHATYNAIGRVEGALSNRADNIYKQFTEVEKEICRWIFLRLTQPGRGTEDTRRRVPLQELFTTQVEGQQIERVLAVLADAKVRLITMSGSTTHANRQFVEMAHEALIKSWPRLRGWLDEDREALHIHRRLTEAAKQWEEHGKDSSYLYRGALLSEVESWSKIHAREMNLLETEFLSQSAALEVEDLMRAPLAAVPEIVNNLLTFGDAVNQCLRALASRDDLPDSNRRRISLALLNSEPNQAVYLGESLLHVDPAEFLLILNAIIPYKEPLIGRLWNIVEGSTSNINTRFRAACALATLDPKNPRWETVSRVVVDNLVNENPLFLGIWIETLRPIGNFLIEPLRAIFRDEAERDAAREAAAGVLVELVGDDSSLIAELTSEATNHNYEMLYQQLTKQGSDLSAANSVLQKILHERPAYELSESERINLGRSRAGAAITLLRMQFREDMVDVFRVGDDPESLTQFVHRLKARGGALTDILECLEGVSEERVRFGLLLTLGEFILPEVPWTNQSKLFKLLLDWYKEDPHSGIHGACGWLLRRLGLASEALEIDRLSSNCDVLSQRQWCVRKIGPDYFTFVIFQPGVFLMGSADNEIGRISEEFLHSVQLTRSFAVADRLITREAFERYLAAKNKETFPIDEWSPTQAHPVVSIMWHEGVDYCRWLTEQTGMGEDEQCYPKLDSLVDGTEGVPEEITINLARPGFRMLTEAEWEFACRCETITPYSFGSDANLLRYYGWYLDNSDERRTHIPGELRPNLCGLFDMHGNVYEWCHDWYDQYPKSDVVDPVGPASGPGRVLRGGGYNYSARDCRSAYRYYTRHTNRNARIGLRIAFTCG